MNFVAYGQSRSTVATENESDTGAVELAPTGEGSNQSKKKGMILPFEPHCITFNDVKYSVDMPQVTCYSFLYATQSYHTKNFES